ncbi:MAG: hypothetical protein AUH87_02290 [Deltaproteobacteria bacterium 13_1_40CM_4_54_4]|nr:MAG: hypothetical protein AUH87_02290 [Deltaproteobacteria bacterium 13_1_40CM_4_54_4]
MTSNPSPFRGLFIPHVTPFDEAGALDLESLERLTAHFTSLGGLAGLVSCARIGEGPVLSVEEKRKVYAIVGNVARKSGRVHIATIAPQSTSEAIALVRDLEKLPVDAVMIFPPLLFAWGKVGGDLKVRFFEDVARETHLPLVLFQVPVKSYWYDVETICRIARLEKVVAFKEASFDVNLTAEARKRGDGSAHRQRPLRRRKLPVRRQRRSHRGSERRHGKMGGHRSRRPRRRL